MTESLYDPELDGDIIQDDTQTQETDYDPSLDGDIVPEETAPDADTLTISVDDQAAPEAGADTEKKPTYSTTMWDEYPSFEAAAREYERLRTSPENTGDVQVVINGEVVPAPSPTLFGSIDSALESVTGYGLPLGLGDQKVSTGIVTKTVGGLSNAAKNVAKTGAAIYDSQAGTESAKAIDEAVPELAAGDTVDQILMDTGGLMVGGMAGAKLTEKVVSSIPIIRNSANVMRLGKALGFEVGAASALSEDSDTLAVGDKAILPIFKGVDVSKGEDYADQLIRKKTNILIDGAMAASALEGVLKGGAWAGKFAWNVSVGPWIGAVSKTTQENTLYRSVADELAGIDENTPPEAVAAIRDRITNLIRENKDVMVKLDQEGVDDIAFQRDTMSAVETALENNDSEGARQLIARARGIRAGGLNKGYTDLVAKVDQANVATDNMTKQMETAFGGPKAVDEAASGLRQSGDQEFRDIQFAGKEADDMVASRENDVTSLFPDEARARDASGKVDLDPYAMKDQATDRIKDKTIQSFDRMDAIKNDKFNAIPEGTQFDLGSFGNSLKQTKAALDDFDQTGAQTLGNSLMRVIDRAYKPKVLGMDTAGEPVVETAEEVIDRISRSGVDFKRLYNDVRPELSKFADDLYAQGKGQAGSRVRDLIKNIDEDQLDFIARNGDEDAAGAAQEAMRYYKEEYAPLWRDGPLSEAAQIRKQTTRNGEVLKPVDLDQQMYDLIGGSLSNGQRARAQQFAKLLSSPEGGGSAKDIVDYALGDAAASISSRMASGSKLSEIDVSDIYNSLQPYMSILKDIPEAGKIQSFMDTLKSTKGDVARLKVYADELKAAAEQAKDRIYGRELKAFFQAQGVRSPNAYASFKEIFDNQQSADVIQGLVTRAEESGNPIVMEGMKAAYSKYMRQKLLGVSESTAGVRQVGAKFPSDATEGLNQSLEYGRLIFKDNPVLIDGLQSVMEQAGMLSRARSAKPIQGTSPTAFYGAAKDSVDRLVTNMLGTLSRTGARIRSGAKTVLENLSPDKSAAKIMDQMLADPDYFLSIADRVNRSDKPMDKDTRDMIYTFMVRAGIYGEDQDDRTAFEKAMDAGVGLENFGHKLIDTTEEAFGLKR